MVHAYKDPYAPPLAPKVLIDSPPWIPTWKQYKGRTEWWAALGYTDPDVRRGMTSGFFQPFEERDLRYLDQKVPDGTSMVGPMGKDSHCHRSHINKWDTPGDFFEYQDNVRKTSSQYKQIAEKWDISAQHPGIAVNPFLNSIFRYSDKHLGTNTSLFPSGRTVFKYHLGPRFWNKPLNEGCFEKGLALVKYTVPLSIVSFLLYTKGTGIPGVKPADVNFSILFHQWARRALVLPSFYAFTFGITSCASATIRDEDDIWNWIAASAVCGLAHAAIKNNLPHAFALTAVGSFLGILFQAIRVSYTGFGLPVNRISQGYAHFTGPLEWKRIPLDGMESYPSGVVQDWLDRFP